VQLDWQTGESLAGSELSPRQVLELAQFVREAVSNALKHASPSRLVIRVASEDGQLQVQVDNDGNISPPENWPAGTGLRSMASRIHALNGCWSIRYLGEREGVSVVAQLPL
jgi:signal transduction histidine kinase